MSIMGMNFFDLLLLAISVIALVIGIIILIRLKHISSPTFDGDIDKSLDSCFHRLRISLMKEQNESRYAQEQALREGLISIQEATDRRLNESGEAMRRGLISIGETTEKRLRENQQAINDVLTEGLRGLQESTNSRLIAMQAQVNDKLDKSLNERLDENFKQVGDRLASLYQSLGELKNLENGVKTLNRTLSNVKSRGVFGEVQLGNILANVLDKSQYDMNVKTRPRSMENVEYAVKIPDKDDMGFIYMPIDSKFPADIYNRLIDASNNADAAGLDAAAKELKRRLQSEAMSIRDKYVAPPYTTDFAVMFLPTEGLYAEALRIDGLAEDLQQRCKVIIAGPMTLTALLNSLSVGFKYLTVNKKTKEIMKALAEFKSQFAQFDALIEQTHKSLAEATQKTESLKDQTQKIQVKLDKVEKLEYGEGKFLPPYE